MQQETQKQQAKKANVPATKTQSAPPALPADFTDGGWDTEVVDTTDLIIPKILLMHPTSELVKAGKRNIGEIIKSTTEEVVAKRDQSFDVIVFAKWKEWRIMKKEKGGERYQFERLEQWTPENDQLPWDFEEDGEVMRRDKTLNFYALIAKEAAEGKAYPVKLSFTRGGFKAGHKIADAYSRAIMEKQAPTRQLFKIGSVLVQADDSYFAFTVNPGEASTDIQKQNALHWRNVVNKAKAANTVVDHEETDNVVERATTSTEF